MLPKAASRDGQTEHRWLWAPCRALLHEWDGWLFPPRATSSIRESLAARQRQALATKLNLTLIYMALKAPLDFAPVLRAVSMALKCSPSPRCLERGFLQANTQQPPAKHIKAGFSVLLANHPVPRSPITAQARGQCWMQISPPAESWWFPLKCSRKELP